MSYAGLGAAFEIKGGFAPVSGGTAVPSGTMVDVGVPPAIVKATGEWLWATGQSMGTDRNKAYLILAGGTLRSLRPNAFGLIDPAAVAKALSIVPASVTATRIDPARPYMPPTIVTIQLRDWVDGAMAQAGLQRLSAVLADIASGKYAGHAPASVFRMPASGGTLTRMIGAPPVRPTEPPTVPPSQPEVQCTDGYFRDARGLCVPNAAPPGPPAQPDTQHLQPPPLPLLCEAVPPCPPGTMRLTPNECGGGECTPVLIDSGTGPGVPPLPGMTPGPGASIATAPPAATTTTSRGGLFGVPWKYVGAGAAGLAALVFVFGKKTGVVPNKRRRRSRS